MGFFCACWQLIWELIAPKQCINCFKFGSYLCSFCKNKFIHFETEHICHVCKQETIIRNLSIHKSCSSQSELSEVIVCVKYNNLVHDIIAEVKYYYYYDTVNLIVDLMLQCLDISKFRNSVLIPIPLHKSKLRQRGFNQAELISKLLAVRLNNLGANCKSVNLIERTRNTLTQVGMSKEERMHNLKSAFRFNKKIFHDLNNYETKIYLIDDVMTTGTTLEECAKVLKQNGVDHIRAVVFARG